MDILYNFIFNMNTLPYALWMKNTLLCTLLDYELALSPVHITPQLAFRHLVTNDESCFYLSTMKFHLQLNFNFHSLNFVESCTCYFMRTSIRNVQMTKQKRSKNFFFLPITWEAANRNERKYFEELINDDRYQMIYHFHHIE